jgi:hypothetical protein
VIARWGSRSADIAEETAKHGSRRNHWRRGW